MALKKAIKITEAKVIVYLDVVDSPFKFVQKISSKLKIDYSYLCRILADMLEKQWVKRTCRDNRSFYELAHKAPIQESKDLLSGGKEHAKQSEQNKLD
jgi:predicted transcriptional regulator